MLAASRRIRSREDFTAVSRSGRAVRGPHLVLHLRDDGTCGAARAGFVVSRAVGGSVARHRTVRVLRHLMMPRLDGLPPGSQVVVRARAGCAGVTAGALATELDDLLRRAVARPGRGGR